MNQADEELNTLVLNKEADGRKKLALGIYIHVPFVPPLAIFAPSIRKNQAKTELNLIFVD